MNEHIEREAVIAIIEGKQKALCPLGRFSRSLLYGTDRETFDNWQEIIDQMIAIPAADVEPVRHGWWVGDEHYNGFLKFCSVCGMSRPRENDHGFACSKNYCPNCGAKMDMDGVMENA